jgi:hypothetical protein
MWDIIRLSAVGNFYLRKIALLIVAGLMSALFVATVNSQPTYADDASWSGNSISYNGNTYDKLSNPPALPSLDPSYKQIYQRVDGTKADIIALKDDTDKTKPITDAQYITYDLNSGQYSNPSPPATVTVKANGGASSSNNGGNANGEQTSCAVKGIGWMLCSTSRFFAGAMDKAYDWVASFLVVKPISTDSTSGLYKAWDVARGLANLCFIVAFLVIIYSQITSVGISNYEIKKMVPKLIIAAILVNVSYFICSAAVDVSNILGNGVQNALVEIRNSLPAPQAQTDWSSITDYILSGATVGAIGLAITSTTGVLALVPLLFPILVSGVLSVLVALLVLAARQALITVLIIISPLAFVAYLLPNTEKMFGKWRELFTNMLMIFPMFSLLFGGSQLAAYLIIQNTDQIQVVLLAMFVQVAPLAITPFLLRISHNLLSAVGNQMNGRKSGIVNKSREFAQERSEQMANRRAAAAATKTGFRPSRLAYKRRASKIHRDNMNKVYLEQIEAQAAGEKRAHDIHVRGKEAELQKNAAHAVADRMFEEKKATSPALIRDSGILRREQDHAKWLQNQEEQAYLEAKTDKMKANNRFAPISTQVREIQLQTNITESAVNAAKEIQREEFGKALIANDAYQVAAGGIAGQERGLAVGVAEYREAYGKNVSRAQATIKHFNLSGEQRQAHAMGEEVVVYDSANNSMKILRADSTYTREAAIEAQLSTGTVKEINQIVEASGTTLSAYRTTIQEMVASNKLSAKAVYLGGQTINDIGQNMIQGPEALDAAILRTIMSGKISENDLVTNDATALERIYEVAFRLPPPGTNMAEFEARVEQLKQAAYNALNNTSLKGNIKENAREFLVKMEETLPGDIDPGVAGPGAAGPTGPVPAGPPPAPAGPTPGTPPVDDDDGDDDAS